MKHLTVLLTVAILCSLTPVVRASNIDLYDFAVSTSTGISGDWQDVSTTDPTMISGLSSTMKCCGDPSGGTTPGLGALSYKFSGAPGTYTVSLYFDYDVSTPNFNEYGIINNAGSAQSGMSYEIFNANSTKSNIVLFGAIGTPGGETFGAANDTNGVPGTTDNFLGTCVGAGCNADVGVALTYNFTLGPMQYAILYADSSTTDPGGFSLETIHPIDANNSSAASVYLTGSYTISGGPEPATWTLLGGGLALLGIVQFRRSRKGQVR